MTQQKKKPYKLTVVAPAYNERSYNMALIDSMLNQTKQDEWRCIPVHNGQIDTDDSPFNKRRDELVDDTRFAFCASSKNMSNYGCYNRQWTIDNCDTDYIIQTSVQDYWLPQAIEYILKIIERAQPDLIIWDSINHLVGPCKVLESKLEWAKIDWGNFCIRTDIAKKVRIQQEQYCADWLYISDLIAGGFIDPNKILKLPYVLTIHN